MIKQVIRGFCHPDIHTRIQLPVIHRLVNQCRIDGAVVRDSGRDSEDEGAARAGS